MVSCSIIVPIHNASMTLTRCVNSLLKQQVPNQIILVDDHSTDNSFELCKELSSKNKNILLIRSEGNGVSEARNTGLKYATGDIVGFCDADDFYNLDTLLMVNEQFCNRRDLDVVVVGITKIYTERNESIDYTVRKSRYISSSNLIKMMFFDSSVMGSSWNKFYRRSLIRDIKFKASLTYCEDAHFNCRILSRYKNLRIFIINKSGYNYLIHNRSATENQKLVYNTNGSLKYVDALNDILNECDLTRRERNVIKYSIGMLSIGHIMMQDRPVESEKWLKADIRRYAPIYLSLALFHDSVNNLKRMIKYLIYCLKI